MMQIMLLKYESNQAVWETNSCQLTTSDKKNLDVGASLFIRNLDPGVGEKMLYDTFSAFGVIVQTPKGKGERHGSAAGSTFIGNPSEENQSLLFADVRPPTVPPPMIGVRQLHHNK
ncbi:hypothetical protein RhiirA5_495786 [Rhizophagus irregularis]|uniref:RRM domain-containing protein n=1 Tax=Rhizophagus irregularis TaxID=588596 RepID=A0A2N0SFT8_9GLOM|nr:hypothetical protein RhiirA5_495786 [Rhizophagus irregularis]PKC74425.1 hypothetical protein RhiirA1_529634 [Rhizophagus irregularis]